MFAILYQGYIKPDREEEYQKLWHTVACYFIKYCGALGSCLHKTDKGFWVAYSRWPDKITRDAAWPSTASPSQKLPDDIRESIIALKDCIDQDHKLPEICMEVVDDLFFFKEK